MHKCIVCGKPAEGVMTDDICHCQCSECGEKCFDDVTIADHGKCYDCHKEELTSSSDPHSLVVNITDQEKTFTEQLEKIISDINEGYTSGYGWSIGELELDDRENTAPKKKAKTPLDEIRDEFYRLSIRKQNVIMKQYIDYVENFPDEHDGGSYPVSFLEWYTNDYQEL